MNAMVKRIIEIAGGLVVGSLMSDAVDKAVEVSKKVIENVKEKRAQ
jgi:tryptophan synthase alpha subunit